MVTDSLAHPRLYVSPEDDARQDIEVGDFRGRSLLLAQPGAKVLEIGAGYAPLFRKADGYDVRIIDHLPTAALIEKYRGLGVDTSRIEQVDHVWHGEPIPELVGGRRFDIVYASHVVEHSTDLVAFLTGAMEVLEETGAIVLLVPDKRYCFDYFQPMTDTAKVLADAHRKATRHSFESLYREEMQVVAQQSGAQHIAWWPGPVSDFQLMRSDPRARLASTRAHVAGTDYVDAHEYFFIPSTFNLIVDELNFLGVLPLRLSLLTRARGCEFMAVLTRAPLGRMTAEEFLAAKRILALRAVREQLEAFREVSG
ncbi:class I SAM-dependent methyltransferase [Roseococcus suduntuyensis]|uniref:2-polyprenyl-3-methyl-5-hydroxy-6-metoxy-1, 4-benzoquinol methylase n=1 Tax=Roseococcus suduntuyensis TaxID=455361 RepID=A0A840A760_9PROT|nr:methyltransferase domain-containing protein [Roseococcus suduntuyensis]MBB3897071.1 2-polyprenyl-3-methyl-5-hydroxy-6-metoxy-1,4-benzoquinol methylase [Roseococcus suduntuyensis]